MNQVPRQGGADAAMPLFSSRAVETAKTVETAKAVETVRAAGTARAVEAAKPTEVLVGCARWAIPRAHADRFPPSGSHLERYAKCFNAVEINSSFYGPHRPSTYARWAASTPPHFRFSVKVPKEITHARRLVGATDALGAFLAEATMLGAKLGPLLVQLPPSFAYSSGVAGAFFSELRKRFTGSVVFEPRHPTWFAADVERLLIDHQVARVAADPAPVPAAALPGGFRGLTYYRLHGSPRMYYSAYSPAYLEALAETLAGAARSAPAWCIFDNTALDAATPDGLLLIERIAQIERLREGSPSAGARP
jgi:uncharacterized protein YecE (DUF72 family)